MSISDPFHAYLNLARRLFDHQINERTLPAAIVLLPPINRPLLDDLATHSEIVAFTQPRLSWAICRVADVACQQQHCDLFTRSLAAWYLARAANHWVQPKKVAHAGARARRGFVLLNEAGWVAACDWITNDLIWTCPDFVQSEVALKEALMGLETAGFEDFKPLCHLALAYHQLLLNKNRETEVNLVVCEAYFAAHHDSLNQARCWMVQSILDREQSHFEFALSKLKQAQMVFKEKGSLPDMAYSFFLSGIIFLHSTTNLTRTIGYFKRAENIFKKCDLELPKAQCLTYMGITYLQVDQLEKADSLFKTSSRTYKLHEAIDLYADNSTLNGLVNLERGFPEKSIALFQQAYIDHLKTKELFSSSNDLINLGNTYEKMGRYQQALQCLELATEQIKPLNLISRLGICEMFTSHIWLQVKDYARALEHLDLAQQYLKVSNQPDSQVTIARLRAKVYFEQGNVNQSLQYLFDALSITQAHDIPSQSALTHRLLGEVLLHESQFEESKDHLQQSLQEFSAMHMQMEQAASLVSLGTLFICTGDLANARKHFEKALHLSEEIYKEVNWRAYAGLAELELLSEHPAAGLEFYRQSVNTISSLRGTLWQPSLAGSYAQTPKSVYGKAVSLAIEQDSVLDALQFIETDKAVTLINQLTSLQNINANRTSQELQGLKVEIDQIQKKLQVNFDSRTSLKSAIQLRTLHSRLQEKSQQYEALLSRLERRENLTHTSLPTQNFSLSRFRELETANLGEKWVALEYYQVENKLITLAITPEILKAFSTDITPRFTLALQACRNSGNIGAAPAKSDLEFLGTALLPPEIETLLTPLTTLLLAPHQELHDLPWAALGATPLALKCIPCIVPSFHSLVLLGERSERTFHNDQTSFKNGLLVGISDFNGAHPALPFVKQEIAALRSEMGDEGKVLTDEEATLAILTQLSKDNAASGHKTGLARYDWLHIASHFFCDPVSGSLSGLALSGETLWLDQIRDLAPLPQLVTFSGCSSIFSRIYSGDEHVGLPTTCFLAGANTIVGSTWPVLDLSSAKLMTGFYKHTFKGERPAQALAHIQRELVASGEDLITWAGFTCLGEA